jgi:hypothetical protein
MACRLSLEWFVLIWATGVWSGFCFAAAEYSVHRAMRRGLV